MNAGVIAGLARHAAPRAAMEVLDRATITPERGVEGDCKGRFKPSGRNRRQVTLIERGDWEAATAALGVDLPWSDRRANILVDGIDLPQLPGTVLRIGDVRLVVMVECDPCHRMDALAPGLQQALRDDWRGGVCTRVLTGGEIAVGDAIIVENVMESVG
ncbi:MAG: MOSC domain-containing protein [Proteobacteria bacterium ST_bin14]|nr:MAG: MOSC domain-containing protein [Proteobacteria bacterium ST_bin14]